MVEQRRERSAAQTAISSSLGIFEIIIILAVALVVLGPERMPDVVRSAVKILREVRLAANEAIREITDALEQEGPSVTSRSEHPAGADASQSAHPPPGVLEPASGPPEPVEPSATPANPSEASISAKGPADKDQGQERKDS